MLPKIILAIHDPSDKVLHISQAANGKNCQCRCVECGEMLEAVQGEIRVHHFRHTVDSDCKGGQETALHRFIKEIIACNNRVALPNGIVGYSNVRIEKYIDNKRPDAIISIDGDDHFVEVIVTSEIDSAKELFFQEKRKKVIIVDFSDVKYLNWTYEQLTDEVLNKFHNKKVKDYGLTGKLQFSEISTSRIFKQLTTLLVLLSFAFVMIWIVRPFVKRRSI